MLKKFKNIYYILFFLLLSLFLNNISVFAIWRKDTGISGKNYAELTYSISEANLNLDRIPFNKVGEVTGVAFWYAEYPDGNDSIEEYLAKLVNGKIPYNEAGIDCSSNVSRCLGISRRGTYYLQLLSLPLTDGQGNYDYSKLKKGDILIKYPSKASPPGRPYGHSMYYNGDGMAYVSSSLNGPYGEKPYHNRVMYVNYVEYFTYLTEYDYSLNPRTLFPIFSDFKPEANKIITDNKPEIKVTVKSGTDILATSIAMKIDGNQVTPILTPSTDAKEIIVSYTPSNPLPEGEHTVYIYAKNVLDLEDDNPDTLHNLTTPDDFLALA